VSELLEHPGLYADADADSCLASILDSLAQAKAQAGMFAPLIEGLKRRLWL